MALFVLILVGVVVAQTWLDWRDANQDWVIPDWAKGMALAGVLAVSLAAVSSFASVWLQDASQSPNSFSSQVFCIELGFLLCMMGVVIFAARKKRLRLMILTATLVVVGATWLGMMMIQ
jgi:hypothetical protein